MLQLQSQSWTQWHCGSHRLGSVDPSEYAAAASHVGKLALSTTQAAQQVIEVSQGIPFIAAWLAVNCVRPGNIYPLVRRI